MIGNSSQRRSAFMLFRKHTTWILIANGARAHIIANQGPGKGLKPVPGR